MKRMLIHGTVLMLLIAGCSRSEKASSTVSRVQVEQSVTDPAANVPVANRTAGTSIPAAPRMIIRRATLRLTATDVALSAAQIGRIAELRGGYVEGGRQWFAENDQTQATLTLRVPGDRLTETLAEIRKSVKRVELEEISGEDVSQEFVDISARLRNHEITEGELRELVKTISEKAKKAEEILVVHRELQTIRTEIEQMRGRLQYLSQMTSYATIQVEIRPDALLKPVETGWQPLVVVRDATRALVATLQVVATAIIWFAIYLLPILLLPLVLIALVVRKRLVATSA